MRFGWFLEFWSFGVFGFFGGSFWVNIRAGGLVDVLSEDIAIGRIREGY
jgi:hypothetical protein